MQNEVQIMDSTKVQLLQTLINVIHWTTLTIDQLRFIQVDMERVKDWLPELWYNGLMQQIDMKIREVKDTMKAGR